MSDVIVNIFHAKKAEGLESNLNKHIQNNNIEDSNIIKIEYSTVYDRNENSIVYSVILVTTQEEP